jgi:hypothetical protein
MVAFRRFYLGRRHLSGLCHSRNISLQAGGGSETVGLTNTVFEVEGISEVEATYSSPVLAVGHFELIAYE